MDGSVTWMTLSRGWLCHEDGFVTWKALSRGLLILSLLLLPGVRLPPGGHILEPHDVRDGAAVPGRR